MESFNYNTSSLITPGITLRTQFTFTADDSTLACVLSKIAAQFVNITGFFITKDCNHKNFIRLVVGSAETESIRDLRVVRNTLKSQDVKFEEEQIIAISTIPAGIPGGLSGLYGSLWCKLQVISIYAGEDNLVFVNVSNIKKALAILSRENVKPCPDKC